MNLERLEPHLRNAGFAATQLTVTNGVEQITLFDAGDTIIIDQNGDTSGGAAPAELTAAIEAFRNGDVGGA